MPPPSRSPCTAELCKRNSLGRSRSSESRLMLKSKKNDEDVDDLFLFTEMKKHESESSAETTHFSARQRDSPKASDGGKNEYNWLLTPPGSPLNGTDREPKPVHNPRNKARTQTTTTPRRSSNGKAQTRGTVATSPRDAKRKPSLRSNQDDTVCVGGANSHPLSFDLISVIEEVPFPANSASEQTFGGVVDDSRQEEGAQETLVDTSKHEKACGNANLKSATQKSHFEKDVLDQNAHVCVTKSETAAELSKTTEAPRGAKRNFASEEATHAILLCNSNVHDLVYESAAIESENQKALTEISRPLLKQLVKSTSDLKYFRYVYYKCHKNSQRFNRKRQEFDTKKTLSDLGTDAKGKEHAKPPKIESKCNCSIM